MRRLPFFALALASLAFGASGKLHAQVVQEYEYAADAIYPVRTGLGITTQIELSPNEKIVDFSTGFSSGWELTRRENVFYLKPKNIDVDTNMLVRTATHSYIFELRVVATDWKALDQAKQEGVQYKIVFRYPGNSQFSTEPEDTTVPQLSTRLEKTRRYDFDYDYSTRTRQRWLIPASVYDDGQFTYIRMSSQPDLPTGGFPAVFAREREGGEDFVVNTTVENDTVVVHGTYPFLVIRHGKDVVGLRRRAK
jgi:type IV secretion system protein VirB9